VVARLSGGHTHPRVIETTRPPPRGGRFAWSALGGHRPAGM